MLSFILRMVQDFERQHGCRPRALMLNETHLSKLKEECLEFGEPNVWPTFGLRIVVLPETELPHPRLLWFPKIRRLLRNQNHRYPLYQEQRTESRNKKNGFKYK